MEIGEVGLPGQAVKVCLAIATDLERDLATIPLLPMEDLTCSGSSRSYLRCSGCSGAKFETSEYLLKKY